MNLFKFITMPIVWIPIVVILIVLTIRNYRKLNRLKVLNVDSVLLMLEIPKANDKKELAAEQLFASLHGILRDANELKNSGGVQEHLSFEIASSGNQIRFFVWVPKVLQSFVEGQIYSQYPSVQIYRMNEDYADRFTQYPVNYSAEITLTDNEALPIKTFESFEVDPLAGITGTLAKLNPNGGEELWVQILTRPVADDWHKKTDQWIKSVKAGKGFNLFGHIDFAWFAQIIAALWRPPEGGTGSEVKVELSERDKTRISKAEEKATKLGYEVKIRLAYVGKDQINAKLNMQALVGTFKQFNSTNLNGFKMVGATYDRANFEAYKKRQFTDDGFVLNISELASVFHLPHTNVETPNIVWASSKTAEPPAKLPMLTGNASYDENISAYGLTDFRGIKHQFGMLRRDRSRHIYIIGQTGSGKSGLLTLFALSDIYHNQGYCIIDPHGDLAMDNLKFIPESRIDDVVYFNPADTQYPMAFNPLEISDPTRKPNISSEVIGVLKRMFGDSWGPRLEHILRYTLLALLDRPSATLLDISRMLTDKEFRKETLDYCKDVTVLQFWKHEFGSWSEKQVTESVAPVLNKVGAFTANPIIRNIIGQPKSSFDVRKIMDEGKILVVNLSKGLIGEDNAAILGAFLVTKVQLAAMSRSDITNVEDRRPFYLYVDEFQNFATDSFAVILSEARKYGLNLTVANQYTSQMTESVRDAVFGNVGTTISFRVSADDAPILSKQFEPVFEAQDLLNLHNRHFVVSMIINGEKAPAFSATTLSIPKAPNDLTPRIIRNSRLKHSRARAEVEEEIRANIEAAEKWKKELSDSGREAGEQGSAKPERQARPIYQFTPTPQTDFRKQKISPNQAEAGNGGNGLKNLGALIKEQQEAKNTENSSTPEKTAGTPKIVTKSAKRLEESPKEIAGKPVTEVKTEQKIVPLPSTTKKVINPATAATPNIDALETAISAGKKAKQSRARKREAAKAEESSRLLAQAQADEARERALAAQKASEEAKAKQQAQAQAKAQAEAQKQDQAQKQAQANAKLISDVATIQIDHSSEKAKPVKQESPKKQEYVSPNIHTSTELDDNSPEANASNVDLSEEIEKAKANAITSGNNASNSGIDFETLPVITTNTAKKKHRNRRRH